MLKNRQLGWIGVDLGTHCGSSPRYSASGTRLRLVQSAVIPRGNARRHRRVDRLGQRGTATRAFFGPWLLRPPRRLPRPGRLGRFPVADHSPRHGFGAAGDDLQRTQPIFGGQEREFDFWDSAAGGSPGRDNTHVLSISQDAASQVISCFSAAGLRCEVLDGLPLALLRAVQLAEGVLPAAPVAAVDWGHSSATFCIVGEGGPLFTRHLRDCGCKAMVQRVSGAAGPVGGRGPAGAVVARPARRTPRRAEAA